MTISIRRWLSKKAARTLVMLSGAVPATLRNAAVARAPRVRAITYHRFGDSVRDPYCVSREVLDEQMRWLAERGLAVSLADVMAFIRGERKLKDGSVLVTMDDGYRSVYSEALPVFKKYKIPAVAYVTTSLIGTKGTDEGHPETFMTWKELAELNQAGITVGSHAHTHRSLGQMSVEEAREEGRRSRELLEENLGTEIRSFAYPFGMMPDQNDHTAQVLADSGYTSVFISLHGPITPGADPIRLPRIKVEGGEGAWRFPLLCQGAMDGWRIIDDNLWYMQRPRLPKAGAR
jgi:peptidoglycan/xylan/chitin deacetylase (PgdA/CDA1 family)